MFNLNDYEDVDTRIHKFYETYPDGAIHTEEVLNDEEKGVVIFKAIAYRTYADDKPASIGYARGSRKDRGVDRDFWYENCETSSIGRCLANLGLSAKGKRASSLEMARVADAESAPSRPPIRVRTKEQQDFLKVSNPEAEVIWDTTIEPPADLEPEQIFNEATKTITEVLRAVEVPRCAHGDRIMREGNGAKGAWRAWFCSLPMKHKKDQCKAIFMMLDPSGKWIFRDEDLQEM